MVMTAPNPWTRTVSTRSWFRATSATQQTRQFSSLPTWCTRLITLSISLMRSSAHVFSRCTGATSFSGLYLRRTTGIQPCSTLLTDSMSSALTTWRRSHTFCTRTHIRSRSSLFRQASISTDAKSTQEWEARLKWLSQVRLRSPSSSPWSTLLNLSQRQRPQLLRWLESLTIQKSWSMRTFMANSLSRNLSLLIPQKKSKRWLFAMKTPTWAKSSSKFLEKKKIFPWTPKPTSRLHSFVKTISTSCTRASEARPWWSLEPRSRSLTLTRRLSKAAPLTLNRLKGTSRVSSENKDSTTRTWGNLRRLI